MTATSLLAAAWLLQQAPAPTSQDDNRQMVEAARRAAQAAERSAKAAERTAEAVEALVKAQTAPVPKPPLATSPAPAALPPGTTPWTGTAGLALIWLTGNSETLTFNATGAVEKKWRGWGLGLKGFATYGQGTSTPGTPALVTALAAGAKVRGDRSVSDVVTVFVAAGGETNHVKSEEFLGFGEAGAGITWLHSKEGDLERVLLRTDLSLHYERESDFQYFPTDLALPSRQLLGPRISGTFRYALRKDVIFVQDAEVIPNILGDARVRVNTVTKLASRLTESFSMNASFALNYDSVPPPGKLPTDTALTVGLELAL